jgi:hypothetical protein
MMPQTVFGRPAVNTGRGEKRAGGSWLLAKLDRTPIGGHRVAVLLAVLLAHAVAQSCLTVGGDSKQLNGRLSGLIVFGRWLEDACVKLACRAGQGRAGQGRAGRMQMQRAG